MTNLYLIQFDPAGQSSFAYVEADEWEFEPHSTGLALSFRSYIPVTDSRLVLMVNFANVSTIRQIDTPLKGRYGGLFYHADGTIESVT